MRWKWFLLATAFFYATAAWAGKAFSPYTGQATREIKALAKQEIENFTFCPARLRLSGN